MGEDTITPSEAAKRHLHWTMVSYEQHHQYWKHSAANVVIHEKADLNSPNRFREDMDVAKTYSEMLIRHYKAEGEKLR